MPSLQIPQADIEARRALVGKWIDLYGGAEWSYQLCRLVRERAREHSVGLNGDQAAVRRIRVLTVRLDTEGMTVAYDWGRRPGQPTNWEIEAA